MNVLLHRIETLVPPHASRQEDLAARLGQWAADPAQARRIRHVFQRTGIRHRHSVIPDFIRPEVAELFRCGTDGVPVQPGTQARNRVFGRHAGRMAVELARRSLDGAAGLLPADVTHVITVSCTGFVNPGPDWQIVTELGMNEGVQRYHLGFMGCYAALPALRLATQICSADPGAVVLVVCIELCSLHMQMAADDDTLLANALFADGAAAALVSCRPPEPGRPTLVLSEFASALAPEGQHDMAWEIGDRGFNLVLSSYVPAVIETNVGRVVADLLATHGLNTADIDDWAVHPGGRSILDKVEGAFGLAAHQMEASRAILRDYGNMSSATVLFVLDALLRQHSSAPRTIAAMAFGPGLTIECALLELVPGTAPCGQAEPAWTAISI